MALLAGGTARAADYLVVSRTDELPARLASRLAAAGGSLTRTIDPIGIAVARSDDRGFKAKASAIPGLAAVLPDLRIGWVPTGRAASGGVFTNPPASGDDDSYFDLQWGHDAVDAPEAWNAGHRGAGVRVAVLDTGFDTDHVDLAPNVDLAASASFVPGEPLAYALPDPYSHGTHVAGIIAAADNGFGTIGVAPLAKLILVKVLSDSGSGAFSWVIAGIVHAADRGADVINMSLGGYLRKGGACDAPEDCYTAGEAAGLRNAVARATRYAHRRGATLIAAAGNGAFDFDRAADLVHLPSEAPHVLSVSATTPIGWALGGNPSLDNPASYTNHGRSAIALAAPGGDALYPGDESCTVSRSAPAPPITRPCWVFDLVFSTGSNLDPGLASYFWAGGTSMAAPYVSGVAAIVIGRNGGRMDPARVEDALMAAADDLGPAGKDDFYGAGRVNAATAVQ